MSITMGQLAQRFHRAADQASGVNEQHLQTFAMVGVGFMKGAIQEYHAVDTGTMLNSTNAVRVSADTYMVGPTTSYAAFVALGTSRMAARPFHITAARKLADRRRSHWRAYSADLGL